MAYNVPRTFSTSALTAAAKAAHATPTAAGGESDTEWCRLASVASMSGSKPYAISVRRLLDGRVQLGCSCPHWKFRCQTNGVYCKHQEAFFMGGLTPKTESGKVKVWFADAGKNFIKALAEVTTMEKAARAASKKAVA